eukprot:scaffold155619_cov28-Prasinocladus_malaysianus.AAC.2
MGSLHAAFIAICNTSRLTAPSFPRVGLHAQTAGSRNKGWAELATPRTALPCPKEANNKASSCDRPSRRGFLSKWSRGRPQRCSPLSTLANEIVIGMPMAISTEAQFNSGKKKTTMRLKLLLCSLCVHLKCKRHAMTCSEETRASYVDRVQMLQSSPSVRLLVFSFA